MWEVRENIGSLWADIEENQIDTKLNDPQTNTYHESNIDTQHLYTPI